MRISKKAIFFLLVINLFTLDASCEPTEAENKNWKVACQSDDVTISYRWVKSENNKRAREMRAQFVIKNEVSKIIPQFFNPESYQKWAAGIKECAIEKTDKNNWYTYTLLNYPWPLNQKDMVSKFEMFTKGSTTTLTINAAPNYIAKKNGIGRINNFSGTWQFVQNNNLETMVEYCAIAYNKPILPRFIQDPIIQNIFMDSFSELKYLSEKL